MTWYGAVDIGRENLVVWVLLSGADDAHLPKWYFPVPGQIGGIQHNLAQDLRDWLDEMRDTIQHQFDKVHWPNPAHIDVGFDSTHRVEQGGGYVYFK